MNFEIGRVEQLSSLSEVQLGRPLNWSLVYRHIPRHNESQMLVLATHKVKTSKCSQPNGVALLEVDWVCCHLGFREDRAQVEVVLDVGRHLSHVRNAWRVDHSQTYIELFDGDHLLCGSWQK